MYRRIREGVGVVSKEEGKSPYYYFAIKRCSIFNDKFVCTKNVYTSKREHSKLKIFALFMTTALAKENFNYLSWNVNPFSKGRLLLKNLPHPLSAITAKYARDIPVVVISLESISVHLSVKNYSLYDIVKKCVFLVFLWENRALYIYLFQVTSWSSERHAKFCFHHTFVVYLPYLP